MKAWVTGKVLELKKHRVFIYVRDETVRQYVVLYVLKFFKK
jgi:hypothetical protein